MNTNYYHEVRNDGKAMVTINACYGEYTLTHEEECDNGWKKTSEYYDTFDEAKERADWYMRRA